MYGTALLQGCSPRDKNIGLQLKASTGGGISLAAADPNDLSSDVRRGASQQVQLQCQS